jgi:hypothetical protein
MPMSAPKARPVLGVAPAPKVYVPEQLKAFDWRELCSRADALGISVVWKQAELDAWSRSCP